MTKWERLVPRHRLKSTSSPSSGSPHLLYVHRPSPSRWDVGPMVQRYCICLWDQRWSLMGRCFHPSWIPFYWNRSHSGSSYRAGVRKVHRSGYVCDLATKWQGIMLYKSLTPPPPTHRQIHAGQNYHFTGQSTQDLKATNHNMHEKALNQCWMYDCLLTFLWSSLLLTPSSCLTHPPLFKF